MAGSLITQVTVGSIQSLLGELGWKTSLAGTSEAPQVVSAVNDVKFNIRFGTTEPAGKGWTDFTISAPFTVDQQVSPVVGAFWNRRNRFARVYRSDTQLFLDMDVVVAGGVSKEHLKYQFAVWADIARLFVKHLRADHAVLARYNASKAAPGPRSDESPARAAGGGTAGSGSKGNGKVLASGGSRPA